MASGFVSYIKTGWVSFHASRVGVMSHANDVERDWPSGSVMDCHATTRGSILGGNGVFTELHVLHKGQ